MNNYLKEYSKDILSKKYNIEIERIEIKDIYSFGKYYNYYERKKYDDKFQYSINWLSNNSGDSFIDIRHDFIIIDEKDYLIFLRKFKLKKINENR